jgi:hypothetical protein
MFKEIFQNRISVISFIITTLSLILAVYQYVRAEKIEKMNEYKCEIRCKDLVNSVNILSTDVIEACNAIQSQVKKSNTTHDQFLHNVNSNLSSIVSTTGHLIRFTKRLNEEHKQMFGKFVYENIEKKFPGIKCFSEQIFKKSVPDENEKKPKL